MKCRFETLPDTPYGARIAAARVRRAKILELRAQGMSQADIGRRFHIPRSRVFEIIYGKWKNGCRAPRKGME